MRRPNQPVKQPPKPSLRQLPLALSKCEARIPLGKEARTDVIDALADLLLEAMCAVPGSEATEASNESED
jgi:hypothetical protein